MDCTDICIRNWHIDIVLLYCIPMWIYWIKVSESWILFSLSSLSTNSRVVGNMGNHNAHSKPVEDISLIQSALLLFSFRFALKGKIPTRSLMLFTDYCSGQIKLLQNIVFGTIKMIRADRYLSTRNRLFNKTWTLPSSRKMWYFPWTHIDRLSPCACWCHDIKKIAHNWPFELLSHTYHWVPRF